MAKVQQGTLMFAKGMETIEQTTAKAMDTIAQTVNHSTTESAGIVNHGKSHNVELQKHTVDANKDRRKCEYTTKDSGPGGCSHLRPNPNPKQWRK